MGLTIRPARGDEVETLLSIQRAASVAAFAHVFPPDEYPYPSDDVRELWRQALADQERDIAVGELDGDAAGVVCVHDDFLAGLYVRPEYQETGVGSALHDWALERLRARGCRRAKLWTLEGNRQARPFYEKRGWALTEETRVVPFPPHPIDVQYAKEL